MYYKTRAKDDCMSILWSRNRIAISSIPWIYFFYYQSLLYWLSVYIVINWYILYSGLLLKYVFKQELFINASRLLRACAHLRSSFSTKSAILFYHLDTYRLTQEKLLIQFYILLGYPPLHHLLDLKVLSFLFVLFPV